MLVACILASARGAVVMCRLVLRYGFTPVSDPDRERADHQLLATRLGHATAGVCFLTTAILATVVLVTTPRQPVHTVVAEPDPRMTERLAVLERERQGPRGPGPPPRGPPPAPRAQVRAPRGDRPRQRAPRGH